MLSVFLLSGQISKRDRVFDRFRSVNLQEGYRPVLKDDISNLLDILRKTDDDHQN